MYGKLFCNVSPDPTYVVSDAVSHIVSHIFLHKISDIVSYA